MCVCVCVCFFSIQLEILYSYLLINIKIPHSKCRQLCVVHIVNLFFDCFYLFSFIGLIEVQMSAFLNGKIKTNDWKIKWISSSNCYRIREIKKMSSAMATVAEQPNLNKFQIFEFVYSIDFPLKSNADFIYTECWINRKSNRRDYKIKYQFFFSFSFCPWISGGYRKRNYVVVNLKSDFISNKTKQRNEAMNISWHQSFNCVSFAFFSSPS